MARFSKLLRCAIAVLLLAFGAEVAMPHVHAATNHDAEFCGGHLADHGAPDEQHPGACPMCRTPHRSRLFAAPPPTAAAPLPRLLQADGPRAAPWVGPRVDLAASGPRAPPIFAPIV